MSHKHPRVGLGRWTNDAAQALALGCVIVTDNEREFSRVAGAAGAELVAGEGISGELLMVQFSNRRTRPIRNDISLI